MKLYQILFLCAAMAMTSCSKSDDLVELLDDSSLAQSRKGSDDNGGSGSSGSSSDDAAKAALVKMITPTAATTLSGGSALAIKGNILLDGVTKIQVTVTDAAGNKVFKKERKFTAANQPAFDESWTAPSVNSNTVYTLKIQGETASGQKAEKKIAITVTP